MKNIIYVVLAMLIFSSCEKPNKIGFVDNGTVINDYQEKKEDGCRNHHRNLVNCTNPHCSQHEYNEQLEELASQQDRLKHL